MIAARNEYANRTELAKALANRVAAALSAGITRNGSAILAVSGGTTPQLFFQHLSKREIAWEKVSITLVDERSLPETSDRSNARLVRLALLQNHAAKARFVPLYANPSAERLGAFDACILGMGNDGHTASFFPGGNTLAEAINPATTKSLITMEAPGAGEPRITFTLPRLTKAKFLALHIEGAEKSRVLATAIAGDDKMQMPVRAVLASSTPIDLYCCP
jgi:6-phosphogluconolactonase